MTEATGAAQKRKPATSAALPTDVSRSTARDRLAELARILVQRAGFALDRVPALVRDHALFPYQHLDVAPADLLPIFHGADTLDRAPLIVVVLRPPANDAFTSERQPRLVGTLARVRTDGEEGLLRLHGEHRVGLDALPASGRPRDLVATRRLTLAPAPERELREAMRAPFETLLRTIELSERQVQLLTDAEPTWMAYWMFKLCAPPTMHHALLRIDDARTLVETAATLADGFVAQLQTNSTG